MIDPKKIEEWKVQAEEVRLTYGHQRGIPDIAQHFTDLITEVERLRSILHDAETTPLAEWATELAAARENVAGTAALLKEAEAKLAFEQRCSAGQQDRADLAEARLAEVTRERDQFAAINIELNDGCVALEKERDAACKLADDNAQLVRAATDERDEIQANGMKLVANVRTQLAQAEKERDEARDDHLRVRDECFAVMAAAADSRKSELELRGALETLWRSAPDTAWLSAKMTMIDNGIEVESSENLARYVEAMAVAGRLVERTALAQIPEHGKEWELGRLAGIEETRRAVVEAIRGVPRAPPLPDEPRSIKPPQPDPAPTPDAQTDVPAHFHEAGPGRGMACVRPDCAPPPPPPAPPMKMPAWFGAALARAQTLDFRAHCDACKQCQKGPEHLCDIGKQWFPNGVPPVQLPESKKAEPALTDKCSNCGSESGSHEAGTGACPTYDSKGRASINREGLTWRASKRKG